MHLTRMIAVVDAHAEGEVGRVITGGVFRPKGSTMFECMVSMERESGRVRDMLLHDPRGSVSATVSLITPPNDLPLLKWPIGCHRMVIEEAAGYAQEAAFDR